MNLKTAALTVSLSALLAAAAAAQPVNPACKPMLDAMEKQCAAPVHLYSTQTSAFRHQPDSVETIYAGGAIYIQRKGQWKRVPMSVQDMKNQEEENIRNAKGVICRHLRDEAVNGEAAAVYQVEQQNEGDKYASTLWVSKSTGRPLKSENDINKGDAAAAMHFTIRYDYNNVQPPAGVK